MLKQMILCSGILSSMVPAFCCESITDKTEQPIQATPPSVSVPEEKMHLEFITKVMSSISCKDIQSLHTTPPIYTDRMQTIKTTIDNFPENVRANLNKCITEMLVSSHEKRENEALWSYIEKQQANLKKNQNVQTNVPLQNKTSEDILNESIESTLRINNPRTYIGDYYFLTLTVGSAVNILSGNPQGYFNMSMIILNTTMKFSNATSKLLEPDAEAFLDLYISKTGDLPIEKYVHNRKMMITNTVKRRLDQHSITKQEIPNYHQQALNEMITKLENYYQNYFDDAVINQAKSGNYPILISKDRKLFNHFQKQHPNDFQRQYVNFVSTKYLELANQYADGAIRMVPRTDRAQARQDFKKALKLMNNATTLLSDKFGGNSPIEKANFKILIANGPFERDLQNLLNNDKHPDWQKVPSSGPNQVANTQANSNSNM